MSVNGLLKATARVLDLVSVWQRQPQSKNHQPDGVELMNAPYPANWIKERLGDWASEKSQSQKSDALKVIDFWMPASAGITIFSDAFLT